MPTVTNTFYSSSNGDRWLLLHDTELGTYLVQHEPNISSGGEPTRMPVPAKDNRLKFLANCCTWPVSWSASLSPFEISSSDMPGFVIPFSAVSESCDAVLDMMFATQVYGID